MPELLPDILAMIGASAAKQAAPPALPQPRAVVTPAGPAVYVPPHLAQFPPEDKTTLMLHLQTKYGASPELAQRWATNILSNPQSPDRGLMAEAQRAHEARVKTAEVEHTRALLPQVGQELPPYRPGERERIQRANAELAARPAGPVDVTYGRPSGLGRSSAPPVYGAWAKQEYSPTPGPAGIENEPEDDPNYHAGTAKLAPELQPRTSLPQSAPVWSDVKHASYMKQMDAEQQRLLGILAGHSDPSVATWAQEQLAAKEEKKRPGDWDVAGVEPEAEGSGGVMGAIRDAGSMIAEAF